MRILALIVMILGLATLVLGILFIPQASSAKQEVTDSIAPLTLDKLDATYDGLDQQVRAMKGDEPTYLTMFAKRTSLGLARTNVGTAKAVMTNGIIDIVVGLGLVLGGFVLLRKTSSAA
jgi:hypothetical protein